MNWLARIKIGWVAAVASFLRLLVSAVRWTLFGRIPSQAGNTEFRRILIYRIGNVGDVLVALPSLSAVRAKFPGAHIALLTSPGRPGAPGADNVLPLGQWFDELLVYHTPDVCSWKGRMRLIRRRRE